MLKLLIFLIIYYVIKVQHEIGVVNLYYSIYYVQYINTFLYTTNDLLNSYLWLNYLLLLFYIVYN